MVITREALEKRLLALEQDKAKALGDLNAIGGAIQDTRFWLAQHEAPEPQQSSGAAIQPPVIDPCPSPNSAESN